METDPLTRFATRLLRRQLFEALADQEHAANEQFKMLMFGSAVVQNHRPPNGYHFRRLARDLDLGVFDVPRKLIDQDYIPAPEIQESVAGYLKRACHTIEAQMQGRGVFPEDFTLGSAGVEHHYPSGYDGFRIEKWISPDELRASLKGKREESSVEIPSGHIKAELDIEQIYFTSPFLPPKPMGKGHFYQSDLREVLGRKLFRMVTPEKFAVRDLADFYNVIETGVTTLDQPTKDLLRAIAIAQTGATLHLEDNHTRELCAVSDANIAKLIEAGILPEMATPILENATRVLDEIFPRDVKRPYNLEPALTGPLNLSPSEVRFLGHIHGIDILPGGRRELVIPEVDAGLLLADADIPKDLIRHTVVSRIEKAHDFEKNIRLARIEAERRTMDSPPGAWEMG